MARSASNKGISKNKFNGSALSTGRNPGGMVAGLTAGTTYGKGEEIKKQVEITGGLPKVGNLPQIEKQEQIKRPVPQIDTFAKTQVESEPVQAGLPIGPGPGPEAGTSYEINQFIFNSWIESGDDSLLQYII